MKLPPPTELAGWGRHPVVRGSEILGEDLPEITEGVSLTRGLGRSYGDASLPARESSRVAGSPLADRVLSFDAETGLLRAEAGLPLWRLNRLFFERGWFTPVSPGTHFVTLGGMVAADVHGKMHHVYGCFGEHVTRLKMRVADGRILECSDEVEPELFRATIAGMGLTGHILEVEVRMMRIPSPWMWQETIICHNLDMLLDQLREAGSKWPFTVTWADLLERGPSMGRGLLMVGRWAQPDEAPKDPPKFRSPISVPPIFPSWLVQPWMVQAANWANYTLSRWRPPRGIIHPETFFYPLDTLRDWNRVYGRRGFTQYQCVLPVTGDYSAHHRFIDILRLKRAPVFLCVIKDCGPEGKGMLSFPKLGVSYALDLPVDGRTQEIVDALNELVIAEGGRIYLAKDAFTRGEHFRAMEPRLEQWLAVRRRWDPQATLRSAQSVRILGDTPP
ncbi:MAG TPA: FAD-binding oxidoreductase [Terriglobales bacterium]|nr:FAD-binding oxidoreductase [Terriglobales bacterium]